MSGGTGDARSERRSELLLALGIFAVLWVSYAYFYQGGGWNENSRMDLVRAIVEDHSLSIDRFHSNTGDKAKFGGHYYSDKAPGVALVAVPVYALIQLFASWFQSEHTFLIVASYTVTVLTVSVAGALLGTLLFLVARKFGASRRGAAIAALGLGLGSTAFPFSTMLFSHQLAALLLFSSFALLFHCRERYSDLASVAAGGLGAAAILTEFPTLPAVVLLGAYHAATDRRWRRVSTFYAGALGPLLVLGIYLSVAFGGPLRVGYAHLADAGARAEMLERGLFGLTFPGLARTVELLIGRYRGLLPYSPVLLLSTVGFFAAFGVLRRERGARGQADKSRLDEVPQVLPERARELWLAVAICGYYVLFVSSYEWWQGGSSFGSRHLVPMLPFLALPLGWVADWRPRVSIAALVVSIAAMTLVTSVQPKPADTLKNPFWGMLVPAFARGEVAANNICPLYGRTTGPQHHAILRTSTHDAFNLGMVMGGRGHKSLLPLLAFWIASAYSLWRATGDRRDQPQRGSRAGRRRCCAVWPALMRTPTGAAKAASEELHTDVDRRQERLAPCNVVALR